MNQRCTARTDQGLPCRNWAVRGSNPPRCGSHNGGRRPPGAPYGNCNAQIHGRSARARPVPRSVEAAVADLAAHHLFLTTFLPADPDHPLPTVPDPVLARLFLLHCHAGLHLSRILRKVGALSPATVTVLAEAARTALLELRPAHDAAPSPRPAGDQGSYCSSD